MATRNKTTSRKRKPSTSSTEVRLEPSEEVSLFIAGQCRHGVDKCSSCTENHRSDKFFVGVIAGLIGIALGAAMAEPYERRTYVILDDF